MTPRRWLNIGAVVILLMLSWWVFVPMGHGCGPAVVEAFRENKYLRVDEGNPFDSPNEQLTLLRQVVPPCRVDGRSRVVSAGVGVMVVGIGFVLIRRQLPDEPLY